MVVQGPAQEATGGLDRRRYILSVNDYKINYTAWTGIGAGNIYMRSNTAVRQINGQDKQFACANAVLEARVFEIIVSIVSIFFSVHPFSFFILCSCDS